MQNNKNIGADESRYKQQYYYMDYGINASDTGCLMSSNFFGCFISGVAMILPHYYRDRRDDPQLNLMTNFLNIGYPK